MAPINVDYEDFQTEDHALFRQRLNIARSNGEFTDICLRLESSKKTFNAHQVILSSASDILKNDSDVIKGISEEDLENILTYIYVGSVQVAHDKMATFLNAARALKAGFF